jgi:hypothetical protein
MYRTVDGTSSGGRRGRRFTWVALTLALVVASYAMPASAGHVCNGCHAMSRALAAAAAADSVPLPEAFAAPTAPTGGLSFLDAEQVNDSVSYTLSRTTIRLRAGRHTLYRFNADTGQLRRTRTVRFSTGRKYRAAHNLSKFGSYSYARITRGTYSGWYVRANDTAGSSLTTFSEARQVRLAKGTHTGVRFYNSTRVTLRRSATLASAATYDVSRRAVFNNKVYFFVTNGPLANRWVARSSNARLLSQDSGSSTAPIAGPPATWKGILLIYRDTDVTFTRSDGNSYRLRTRMSDSMYKMSRDVVNKFVNSARNWSDSYASMDLKIVDVPRAITSLDALGNGTYWVGPRTVREDMNKYAPSGTYDSIFVLWQANDDKVRIPLGGWGLTVPPGPWANGAGYSSITTPGQNWWWTDAKYPQEVFVHEWMHQVLFLHENAGRLKLDLHADAQYGYKPISGSYKHWLADVMRGLVKDGSKYRGVTYEIWRSETPTRPNGW